MNIDNIRALAARLRSPAAQRHFYMGGWIDNAKGDAPIGQEIHNCGTTACIAGHAFVMAHPDATGALSGDVSNEAQSWLGLNGEQAAHLFYPWNTHKFRALDNLADLTDPLVAADVLDHLADTGEVEWPA